MIKLIPHESAEASPVALRPEWRGTNDIGDLLAHPLLPHPHPMMAREDGEGALEIAGVKP